MMGQPHKHAALIKAWAEGATIQVNFPNDAERWTDTPDPAWGTSYSRKYRIKPEPKPDLVVNAVMEFKEKWKHPYIRCNWTGGCPAGYQHNLKLGLPVIAFTFDGETDQLKKVEIVSKGEGEFV